MAGFVVFGRVRHALRTCVRVISMTLAAALTLPAPVAAATVPDAVYKVQAGSILITGPVPGTTSFDVQLFDEFAAVSTQRIATARTSAGGRPQADVQGHLSWNVGKPERLTPFDTVGLLAEASIEYFVMVVPLNGDPNDLTPVPLVLTARGHADASGPGASATAVAFGISLNELATAPTGQSSFDQTITAFQIPNVARSVFVRARGSISASLLAFNSGLAEFQAVADPIIVIDPAFELRDNYRLEFSANLVPLPPGVWLLGSAATALLVGFRRAHAPRVPASTKRARTPAN